MGDSPFEDDAVVGTQPGTSDAAAPPSWLSPASGPPTAAKNETQPSWLSEPKAAPTIDQAVPGDAPVDSSAGPPPMDISCSKLPRPVAIMRCSNVVASFFIALLAALKLEKNTGDISSGVISLYLFAFALVLFIFETHISCSAKIIAENFGFMYRATGRVGFMLLLGMLCFAKSPLPGLGIFVGILVILIALFNGFIFIKFPLYERSCRIVDLVRSDDDSSRRRYDPSTSPSQGQA